MNYELAKELKDAGFLFNWQEGWTDVDETIPLMREYPTLEELIEACKKHPMNRKDIGLYTNGDEYVAWARKTNLDEGADGDRDVRGSTPTEAVARLWLALNKNHG